MTVPVYFLRREMRRRLTLTCSVSVSKFDWSEVTRLSWTSCSCRISINRASIRARRLATGCTTAATIGGTLRRRTAFALDIRSTLSDGNSLGVLFGTLGRRSSRTTPEDIIRLIDSTGPLRLRQRGVRLLSSDEVRLLVARWEKERFRSDVWAATSMTGRLRLRPYLLSFSPLIAPSR